ncbi:endoribonuclease Dicer-like isoform X2 [Mytilus californianus]|uniref:endoribonuclease Dicer-like isoform X2 n=1 Tax=Mytilus californianus TaxID=6549 RepID=UPI002246D70F|nr:endoribonuclease Dicer-like isoform X2 [Mytilus californianus]
MVRIGPDTSKRLPRHLRNEDIPTHTFTPPTYQVELLDAALHRNTIVCLGASSGKMFLAVMVLRESSYQLRKPLKEGGKRSVYLTDNETFVDQQVQIIQHHTDLQVSQHLNKDSIETMTTEKWQDLIKSNHILFLSSHVLNYVLQEDILHPSEVNVLIFEDCHVVNKDPVYAQILQKMNDTSLECKPRILGLTSSVTATRCQNPADLESTISTLETKLDAVAETSTLIMSQRYGIWPKEQIITCEKYEDTTGLVDQLENILLDALEFLEDFKIKEDEENENKVSNDPCQISKTVVCECLNILYKLGPWCAASIAQMFLTQLEKMEKQETEILAKKFLRFSSTQLRMLNTVFENNFTPDYNVDALLLYASPKVRELVNHLKNYKPDYDFMIISSEDMDGMMGDNESDMSDDSEFDDSENEDDNKRSNVIHVAIKKEGSEDSTKKASDPFSVDAEKYLCGIVFVDHRFVAIALNKMMEEVCSWDDSLCFVKCHQITGQKKKTLKKDINKKQEDILRKFRLQELNLLIATSFLEDGIDVPRCNMIMKFDPPKDYRSYSRSKGLARAKDAEYLILIDDNKTETFKEDLQMFKGVEKVLIGWRQNKESENDLEIIEDDLDCIELLPPYYPNSDMPSIQVNLCNAIALVNRYCAKLPSDAFTHLTPKCHLNSVKVNGALMYQAKLRLPINSPIKLQITSDFMPTKSLAKRAVALKMCENLHEEGELDDQLAPVGKELFSLEEDDNNEWDDEDLMGEARPGTTKRKQYYLKKTANILLRGYPEKQKNNLYLLKMKLTKPISDDQNTRGRKLNDPEETSRSFGLLTSVTIPQVPEFPVYTRSGEVTVSIELLTSDVFYSHEELERLSNFHRFVFSNVLRLEKDPMIFSPNQAELGYLIIPLAKATQEIAVDWEFIEKVEKYKLHERRNIYDTERELFEFTKEDYEDAVVMPGYRNIDQPQHFYVAEIRMDLNPASPFPSPELYKTFAEYYITKYGLSITNYEQPLLDVDHTSARLNLLTPRYLNQKGVALPTSSAETKKARRENLQQKQILIPELCEIHVFPASFWRKAVCLPTILYRMNCLLVSEELRIIITEGANIGQASIPQGFIYDALSFSFLKDEETDDIPLDMNPSTEQSDDDEVDQPGKSLEKSFSGNGCDINSQVKDDFNHTNVINVVDGETSKCTETFQDVDKSLETKENTDNSVVSANGWPNDTDIPLIPDSQSSNTVSPLSSNPVRTAEVCCEFDKLVLSKSENENNMNKEIEIQMNQSHSDSTEQNGNSSTEQVIEQDVFNQNGNSSTEQVIEQDVFNQNGNSSTEQVIEQDVFNQNGISSTEQVIEQDVFNQVGHFGEKPVKKKEEDIEVTEEELNKLMSFDTDVVTGDFIGPSPCMILQALTMSNANDFFSLERLETIGDSFLKYAITVYLFCTYPGVHEGKLSYLRSKQVSNCNLYRLGKKKGLAECMISTKFEPYENWLPPGYLINEERRKGPVPKVLLATKVEKIPGSSSTVNFCDIKIDSHPHHLSNGWDKYVPCSKEENEFNKELKEIQANVEEEDRSDSSDCLIPYCLQTLHSLPDKSIADCVESLIGCYLTSCGKKVALRFMSWLGLRVLPQKKTLEQTGCIDTHVLSCPSSPLFDGEPDSVSQLQHLLIGFDKLEDKIHYHFKDRSYLLQAFTHASYHYNTVTDCYQRLEFLGDAILDYVITRHLYEDSCKYSPGVLTDLRSALVNNNIFAALAVKWDFHKFFKAISPPLFNVIEKFVTRQKEREDEIDLEDEEEEGDDEVKVELEVPKALGDIFESLAGAIYLDSGMSLDTVWRVYYRIMKPQIEKYLKSIPKSPVRELLEMEPETAKFEKPERTLEGKIRVSVNVVSKGVFTGVGRNYRIAKSAAAKKALRGIKTMQAQGLVQ